MPMPCLAEVRIASSRPFLPQAEPVRGAVPIPADRPFELGHEEATGRIARRQPANEGAAVTRQAIAPVSAQSKTAEATAPKSAAQSATRPAAPDQWERDFAARFAPAGSLPAAPTAPAPASAFASPAPTNGAVMSGRGLY